MNIRISTIKSIHARGKFWRQALNFNQVRTFSVERSVVRASVVRFNRVNSKFFSNYTTTIKGNYENNVEFNFEYVSRKEILRFITLEYLMKES